MAERLDEGLKALTLLWSGNRVTYRGKHITLDDVQFLPPPVQRPRVPIWVGGKWPNKAPMRRAARYDGAIPILSERPGQPPRPKNVRELRDFITAQRAQDPGAADRPFELVCSGTSPVAPGPARDLLTPLTDAGMTWWHERTSIEFLEHTEPILRRIDAGPPTSREAPRNSNALWAQEDSQEQRPCLE